MKGVPLRAPPPSVWVSPWDEQERWVATDRIFLTWLCPWSIVSGGEPNELHACIIVKNVNFYGAE